MTALVLVTGMAGVATAGERGETVEQVIQAVTGVAPEVVTGETSIGDILTVGTAPEVDTTYVAADGDRTSIVASIEDPDVTTVTFDLDLEDGYVIYLSGDGGGFVIDEQALAELQAAGDGVPSGTPVDATLAVAATLHAPWAVDAAGRALPTRYELDGNTLVQHVDTDGAVFPVAADPSWGLGWQYVTPVIYFHYSRAETHDISTYRPSRLAAAGWVCDFLPGWAVSGCRALLVSRAENIVAAAKSAHNSGRCLSIWQGYGNGVSVFFYSAYSRAC